MGQQGGIRHRHEARQALQRAAPSDQALEDELRLLGVNSWCVAAPGKEEKKVVLYRISGEFVLRHEGPCRSSMRRWGLGRHTASSKRLAGPIPARGSSSSTAPTRPLSAA